MRMPKLVRADALVATLAIAASLGMGTAQVGAQDTLPRREMPFAVGERMTYAVKFGPIHIGSGSMVIAGRDSVRGQELLHLVFTVRGGTLFFHVADTMESWFDSERLRSLRFTQDLHEGSHQYHRRFEFFPETRTFGQRGKP